MTAVLAVTGISHRFGGLQVLSGVGFAAERSEIVALIGPNGAGKTTLLNILSGIIRPQSGEVRLDGLRIDGLAPHRIARLGLARTFQTLRLFPSLTVLEHVCVALASGGPRERGLLASATSPAQVAAARSILQRLALDGQRDVRADALPYGQQRRLEIARAIARAPRLLLLDEPSAGLAATDIAALVRLIGELAHEGLTILLIEHNMGIVRNLASRVVVLDHGVGLASGTLAQVAADPAVIEAYLGD